MPPRARSPHLCRTPLIIALIAAVAGPFFSLQAQIISLRTVPLAAGNQFGTAPSLTAGMGGATIALSDEWADPFANPALGMALEESRFIGSPSFYGFDLGERGARTLPMTGLFTGDRWFGGGTVAFQQLLHDRGAQFRPFVDFCCFEPNVNVLSDRSSSNLYGEAFLGRRSTSGRWAWGLGVQGASLNGVDGVELLYSGSDRIVQGGSMVTLRGGLAGTWDGDDQWEVAGAFRRFDMSHDVTWTDWIWRGIPDGGAVSQPVSRLEQNRDRTHTWALDLTYSQPVAETGWRVGGKVTGNYKDHPKIPNYQIMNIPRDPGTSWVYNFGAGIAKDTETTSFALDAVLEPAWSNTWADALTAVRRVDGILIPAGDKTIENDFTFLNAGLRMGFEQRYDQVALQLGLGVKSVDYDLTQVDWVELTVREEQESWVEWTPTWGVTLDLDQARIRYSGSSLVGAGAPGVAPDTRVADLALPEAGVDILLAASGPLTLQDVRVTTHRIAISLPIH